MDSHRQSVLANPVRNLWESISGSRCLESAKVVKDRTSGGRVSKLCGNPQHETRKHAVSNTASKGAETGSLGPGNERFMVKIFASVVVSCHSKCFLSYT